MKVDINKTYRTKCGYPVVIYAIHERQSFGVHGAWQDVGGGWRSRTWMVSGRADISGPTDLDLVEGRPERVVWINEYEYGVGAVYLTEDDANKFCSGKRIALHRVVLNEDTVWKEKDDE